jgi:predicted alpha/beta-hydrolase family hydrolase
MPDPFTIAVPPDGQTTARLFRSPAGAVATLILGHGAGAGQNSAFMVDFATRLAEHAVDVVTFNFLYTERRRRLPDRTPSLENCYRAVIAAVIGQIPGAARALFIGGKSMGGRIATQVAAADQSLPLAGLVLLGYPLHPPGRPEARRDKHLPAVARPILFIQGSRDAFGAPDELRPLLDRMSPRPALHVVEGGDHSFKLPGRNRAAAQADVFRAVHAGIAEWIRVLVPHSPERMLGNH